MSLCSRTHGNHKILDIRIKTNYSVVILNAVKNLYYRRIIEEQPMKIINCINALGEKTEINIENGQNREIDAGGMYALPGLVDLHVHFRDPGQTHKEDIFTGAKAAASGGVTSVIAMPNTAPPADNPEILSDIAARAKEADIRIYQSACITKQMKSEQLTDFDALAQAGAAAFSDDGLPVRSDELMKKALIKAAALGLPVLSHSEVLSLAENGKVNEGEASEKLGLKGMPKEAEYKAIEREIALCEETNCPLHICHVSTKESIDLVREAKKKGIKITCETAPHYFTFTEKAVLSGDADYRMNPPLRTENDRQAVIEGLKDGTIDCIATDHAPHAPEEKDDFKKAPNGVIGLQTSLSASYTALVKSGILTMRELIKLMSENPAKIAKINRENDVILFDPNEKWTVEKEELAGKSKNTPFKGMELFGKVKMTVCRGKIVYEEK